MMFRKHRTIYISILALVFLAGCTERPSEERVEREFKDLKAMLQGLDNAYAECDFSRKGIRHISGPDRDEGQEEFEMEVSIVCGNETKQETVRILYEYTVDLKDHAGPYWELAAWSYIREVPN
jgi:hypothetical protein